MVSILWIVKEFIYQFLCGPWFLWGIWWCSFVIIIVRHFFDDNKYISILVVVLTFIIPDSLNFYLYKFVLPFFLLAYVFNEYDYKNKFKKVYFNKWFISSCISIFVILLFYYNYDSYIYTSGYTILNKCIIQQVYNNIFRFFIGMVGSITIMYLIYALMQVLPDGIKQNLSYIGKNTFGIYLVSGFIFEGVLQKITTNLAELNYLYMLIEVICILGISILINAILKRNKLTNRLFLGGR